MAQATAERAPEPGGAGEGGGPAGGGRRRRRLLLLAAAAALLAAGAAAFLAVRHRERQRPAWRLAHGEPAERAWAAREVAKAGPAGADWALLERALADQSPAVACAALEGFARFPDPARRPAVVRLAGAGEIPVRLKALETLGALGGETT